MSAVNVRPLPTWARKTKYKPLPPPIFDGDPTPADRALARELFLALDRESQAWYARCSTFDGLLQHAARRGRKPAATRA